MYAVLYRFWKTKDIEAAGSLRPEQALMQSLGGGAAPEQRRGERLQDLDRVKFLLMTHVKFNAGQVYRTSDMRCWLEGKLKHVYPNLATKVQEAAEGLELSGFIVKADLEKKQPGRKVVGYEKAKYADLGGEQHKEANRVDLQCDSFEV